MPKSLQKMYIGVPPTYECLNHFLTFGLDILWRRKAAQIATASGGTCWLDVGIGTGEMAFNLCRLAPENTQVVALDFSLPMMREAMQKRQSSQINFTLGEATQLPFADNSIDAITISFAARNIDSSGRGQLLKCLQEFYRILKPGSVLVILESSHPRHKPIRILHHLYIGFTVYPIGRLISGSESAYRYLSRSMQKFYGAEELQNIIYQAGFTKVNFNRLLFGAAAIHSAIK